MHCPIKKSLADFKSKNMIKDIVIIGIGGNFWIKVLSVFGQACIRLRADLVSLIIKNTHFIISNSTTCKYVLQDIN